MGNVRPAANATIQSPTVAHNSVGPDCRGRDETESTAMSDPQRSGSAFTLRTVPVESASPVLDEFTRRRLGRELRALYDPVIDEPIDPRLAELLQQLEADRSLPRG